MKVHGAKPDWYDAKKKAASFSSDPVANTYDERNGTGYPRQAAYNEAIDDVARGFYQWWEKMTAEQGFLDIRSRLQPPKDAAAGGTAGGGGDSAAVDDPALDAGKVFKSGGKTYILKNGKGYDGLWYNGPREILEEGKQVWCLPEVAKAGGLWYFDGGLKAEAGPGRFKPPWLVDPENPDSDLERWIYEGIGTVTYFMNEKPGRPARDSEAGDGAGGELAPAPKPSGVELVLWSEQDEVACAECISESL